MSQPQLRAASGIDGSLLPAFLAALALLAVVAAVVGWILFGLTDWLGRACVPFYALGLGAAVLAGMVALWLNGRLLARDDGPLAGNARVQAGRVQSLLAAAFLAKLFILGLAAFGIYQAGAKFEQIATFAITFAASSLLVQLATAAGAAHAAARLHAAPRRPAGGGPTPSSSRKRS